MITPSLPSDESERLEALHSLNILDTPPEERFDRITRLATKLFKVPIAIVTLVDSNRQWFKSAQGLSVSETPRSISFCGHAILQDELLLINDAQLDPRFADNPLVTGDPFIRFYAGQPLKNSNGLKLGTLCLIDSNYRDLNAEEQQSFRDLAALVENELNSIQLEAAMRHTLREQAREEVHFQAHLLDIVQQAVIATDPQGKIIYWNKFAEQLYGWAKAEVLGQAILDVIPPPDAREKNASDFEAAASENRVIDEYYSRKRDGTVFPIQAATTPVYDEKRQLIAIVGVSNDISERKRAEQLLRFSEQRFRALIENSTDLIILNGPKGEVLYQSPSVERVMGLVPQDWNDGKTSFDFVHPDDKAALLIDFEDLLASPQHTHTVTFRAKHKTDGSWHYLEATSRNLLENTAVSAIVVNARDVTDRYLTEEKLHQQALELMQAHRMEAVGRLTGGIAHDFNNLMTAILGYAELLLAETAYNVGLANTAEIDPTVAAVAANNQLQDLLEIKRTAERATDLTRQLLAFSRQQVLHPETINLGQLITNLNRMLHRLIGENVTLDTTIEADLGLVRADPSQIEQIIVNLIVNARDAMPEGGIVEIKANNIYVSPKAAENYPYKIEAGHYVCLAIKDNGMGMDQETLSHIFEPFYTTKPINQGTGLGLATVYGIVKQSSGFITVDSAPGAGTIFKVHLPQLSPLSGDMNAGNGNGKDKDKNNNSNELVGAKTTLELSAAAGWKDVAGETTLLKSSVSSAASFNPPPSVPVSTSTVLVIEDEASIRELLVRCLKSQNLKVLSAANGSEAQSQMQSVAGQVDLILTDVVLPDMRGPELVGKLRQLQPAVKIILMSGYSEEAIVGQGQLVEGAAFLEKPFNLSSLLQMVREALVQHPIKTIGGKEEI